MKPWQKVALIVVVPGGLLIAATLLTYHWLAFRLDKESK